MGKMPGAIRQIWEQCGPQESKENAGRQLWFSCKRNKMDAAESRVKKYDLIIKIS